MTDGTPDRALGGKALLGSAALMLALAAALWWGWLPIGEEARVTVSGLLVLVAGGDLYLALRFLGEGE